MLEVVKNPPLIANPLPRYNWRAVAKAARKARGDWVVVPDKNPGVAGHIKKATYRAFAPAGAFEVQSRPEPTKPPPAKPQRRVTLYVRYVL